MQPDRRLSRVTLVPLVDKQVEVFLQDLLTANVEDVVGVVGEAYVIWAKGLELEDVHAWAKSYGERYKPDYERLNHSKHLRFIAVIFLGDYIMHASINTTHPRAKLTGWRHLHAVEAEGLVSELVSWLTSLPLPKAFGAISELFLRWTERYNAQMGIEFAQYCGRGDAAQYTDENLTMFLRWCLDNDLRLADAGFLWRTWAD